MIQKLRHTANETGQALVEFALAATLIFMLLAAAVDLGLIFLQPPGLEQRCAGRRDVW
ncbi:MAG: pilus assembly protein [Blastochloris sp.]|nr:pilus assembly protein [Blastochloris sp.]